MTIRDLKIFIAVAECGKMNLAAKKLYISQPSVSQTIQELEKYYGVKLFERLSQRLYITDVGKELLPYAYHIVDSYNKAEEMLQHAGEQPVIRIGASITVGTCFLEGLVDTVEKTIDIKINAVIDNTTTIEHMVLNSALDIGIVEGMVESPDLIQIPLYEDELVIIAGKEHPFYTRKEIAIEELNGQSEASREDGSQTRNQYERLLAEKGIGLYQKWNSTNTEAIKNIVMQGKDIAILSRMLVEKEVRNGELSIVPVKDVQVKREINLIYHKNKFISRSLEEFIEICRRFKR